MPLVFWMFKRRMDVEEAFMVEQFGAGYRELWTTPLELPVLDLVGERPQACPEDDADARHARKAAS